MIAVFGTVWFYERGIANILYLRRFKDKYNDRYYHNEYIFVIMNPTHEVLFNTSGGRSNTTTRGIGAWY